MEVHSILGKGHNEAVYAEALEYEFKKYNIPYEREKAYYIYYKDIKLSKFYYSDFTVYDNLILELKAISELTSK